MRPTDRHRAALATCRLAALAVPGAALAGCGGIQSALDPAGAESEAVARLFWVMVVVGALVWLFVMGVLVYAARHRGRPLHEERGTRFIFFGGVVFPTITLLALLTYALWLMPWMRPFAPEDSAQLRVEVVGKQFWWRVTYVLPDGRRLESANEIRLPVGQRVEFTLTADDVIHSFWIPSLGGKMDMIPGRTNRTSLLATRPGTYRGPCAEFCGTSHALMAFAAVAMPPAEFDAWIETQAAPRSVTEGGRGLELFLANGCGACHAVAGTPAAGRIGPDLTHLGTRVTLGAGILDNDVAQIARFIAEPDRVKPGVQMPDYAMLPREDIEAIAGWLAGGGQGTPR